MSKRPPTKEKILVVEDDKALREGLAINLEMQGYKVLSASDGEKGMQMAFDSRPDLIVLDIMMPVWTGLDILEELRKRDIKVPVLILSARNKTNDKVEGLELGADDYMTKPFDLPELIARIKVMLRRKHSEKEDTPDLSFGNITINQAKRSVEIKGKEIKLSAKEFDLLCLFAASPGHVFTRDKILEKIWGWDYDGTARTVDNFIASLRKKIEVGPNSKKHIQTMAKLGYKLETK